MLISMKHRFLFIHAPKTGGTSIRTFLAALGAGQLDQVCDLPLHPHSTAAKVRDVLGPELFARLFSFAFVRNPWDLEFSTYRYILGARGHWQHAEVARFANFKHYLTFYYYKQMERSLGAGDPARRTQMDFVCDADGSQLVSFVGRYENLAEDFRQVLGRLGLGAPAALPHENRSTSGEYRRVYTSRMVDYVMEMHEADIRRFNYAFEGGTAQASLASPPYMPASSAAQAGFAA